MSKPFREVFPGLKGDRETEGLFELMEVSDLRVNQEKSLLFVRVIVERLAEASLLRKIEKQIDLQVLSGLGMHCRFLESYRLPARYSLGELLEFYQERLIQELSEEMPVDRRFLMKGDWQASENGILVTLTEHPITRKNEKKWRENITRLFAERFSVEVRTEIRFKAPEEHVFLRKPEEVTYLSVPDRASEETVSMTSAASFSASKAGADALAPEDSGYTEYLFQEALQEKSETAENTEEPQTVPTEMIHSDEAKASPKDQTEKEAGESRTTRGDLRKGDGKKGSVRTKKLTYGDDPNLIYGRTFEEETRPISDYGFSEEGNMVIHGQIVYQEVRELRNGERSMLIFTVTDFTDSINVKIFVANEDVPELAKKLSEGTCVRLKGLAQYDTFDKELSIRNVHGILKIDQQFTAKREDLASVKRVELHCHTKASENDGMAEVSDLIKTAMGWGHTAMAVTDHGCVYAFPDAFHTVGKGPFKVIYGMEGYLVDDTKQAVVNPGNLSMDAPCVVFDIETTGFSPVKNRIIEIGAVKIAEGKILDRYSTFVNPGVPIPYRIENLTGINDAMVRDAKTIEEILPAFLSFTEGCYLVAHNAEFDVSFITENAKRLGLFEAPFTYADTVGIGRALLPQISRYRLETMAKELNVPLGNHHRAVDDAECTAKIYLKLLQRLRDRNCVTLKEVQEFCHPTPEIIKKLPSYHVILLAKSEVGRVNLYHLVSESSLNYFARRPRIPKSLLTERREGLIVGSACSQGELFNAILEGAPEEELKRLVDFYDYLEIQPIGNNHYLLEKDNEVNSTEDLQNLNREIVKLGERYEKPVCATGDVHFLNPEDGIYREILQSATMGHGKGGSEEGEDQAPLYLRTTEEMLAEFDYLGADKAFEVVVTNTNLIADQVEVIAPVRPDKCPPVIENSDETLRRMCFDKAHALYGDPLPEIVEARLEKELHSIISNGYAVMYMIAQKLVNKSVSDGYLVGSRGSVGSSLAATMSGITEVNPLPPHYRCPSCKFSDFDSDSVKEYIENTGSDMPDRVCPVCGTPLVKDGYNIPFETFLGFKGDKEPDIDLNFSGEYQTKAHAYVEVIFGKGQTFKAGTIGTVAEKTAYGYTLHYLEDHEIQKRKCEITRLAHHLEGVRASSGQHPGGIIVLPLGEDINTFTPVQHPANKDVPIITTHFDYHSIDSNLLKLDILGHDDPTMIRMLQDLTGKDPRQFPLDAPEVMSLFQSTKALGVTPEEIRGCPLGALGLPEFGTDNAISMLLETKPKYISDLIRISGLAHGTNVWHGNAQTLISEGKCTIQTAVCTRDDIMMNLIARGMDPGESFSIMESVRKGKVAKGKCKEWDAWKKDMEAHDVPDWYIWSCEHIEYMFPKAHAAAYVMMALRIAYCKVFYPLAYYCAYFSIRANGFDYALCCQGKEALEKNLDEYEAKKEENKKDVIRDMRICQEMYARGFRFQPIQLEKVNATRFTIMNDKELMPSLVSIAGLGDTAAVAITEAVKQGPFTSVSNFRARSKVSQTIVDMLVSFHILDGLPQDDQFNLFDSLN